jgi:hypothetical protein
VLLDRSTTPLFRQVQPRLPEALRSPGAQFDYKRWKPFTLLRPRDWQLFDRAACVPWPVIRDFRRGASANGGYLREQDWLRLARLEPEQLEWLAEEFRDAGPIRQGLPVLRIISLMPKADRRAAAQGNGAGWQDLSRTTRARLLQAVGDEQAYKTRLLFAWSSDARPPRVRVYLTFNAPRAFTVTLSPRTPIDPKPLF